MQFRFDRLIRFIQEVQLVSGGDVEDANKMPIISSGFINLLTLSGPDNANCLIQIHHRIHQSLTETQDAEQNALDRTTYQI